MDETRAILKSVSKPPASLIGVTDPEAWAMHALLSRPDDMETLTLWFAGAMRAAAAEGRDSMPTLLGLGECVRVLNLVLDGLDKGVVVARPVLSDDGVKRPLQEIITAAIVGAKAGIR
jgi:hypothetical protein